MIIVNLPEIPSVVTKYCSSLELAEFMNISSNIPSPQAEKTSRINELVGVGDGSTTIFYTNYPYVLSGSYTLYYGSDETTEDELEENNDYLFDVDLGKITLTTTGLGVLGTNNLYVKYSYVDGNIGVTDSVLWSYIDKAQNHINKETDSIWVDGTLATPDYNVSSDEKLAGKGRFRKDYYTIKYPVADVYTELTSDVAISDTTISVTSTNGFPSSGVFAIGTDKVSYTGKTTTTFTGCSNVLSTHTDGDKVTSWVIESSTTEPESTPSWNVLEEDTEYDIDFNSGRVYLYKSDYDLSGLAFNDNPPLHVPNRVRLTYLSGHDSVPEDIKNLTMMIASKNLMHSIVRKSTISGLNNFNPSLINVDDEEIKSKLQEYKSMRFSAL
jgi:hypothetical protein